MSFKLSNVADTFCNPDNSITEKKEALNKILKNLNEGNIELKFLVETLGDYLTSSNDTLRSRATDLLSTCIQQAPQKHLNNEVVDNFGLFFSSRLHDYMCLTELLPGLVYLLKECNPNENVISSLVLQLFSGQIHIPSTVQQTRYKCYEIIECIIHKYPQECGVEFVSGFIQSIDGERDPRNLLKVLEVFNDLCRIDTTKAQNAIRDLSEELFDVISCYFPVSFRPPPNDPHNITPEVLTEALRKCLTASEYFAPQTVPFLLEKLASAVTTTKLEALQVLGDCVAFPESKLKPFFSEIFSALRTEILRSSNAEVVSTALTTISRLSHHLSKSGHAADNLYGLVFPAISEIRSPEARFARPYALILRAAASASENACEAVCETVFHELNVVLEEEISIDKCEGVLDIQGHLLEAMCLYNYTRHLEQVHSSSAKHAQAEAGRIRFAALFVLTRLVLFETAVDVTQIYPLLLNALLFEQEEKIRTDILSSLQWTAKLRSKHVCHYLLVPLINKISDDNTDSQVISNCTEAVEALTADLPEPLPSAASSALIDVFDQVKTNENKLSIVLDLLGHTVSHLHTSASRPQDLLRFIDIIADRFSSLPSSANDSDGDTPFHHHHIHLASQAAHRMTRMMDGARQSQVLQHLEQFLTPSSDDTLAPLDEGGRCHLFVPVVGAVLLALRQETSLSHIEDLSDKLRILALSPSVPDITALSAAQCLASLVNKTSHDEIRYHIISSVLQNTEQIAQDPSESSSKRIRSVHLLGWMGKSVTMRSQVQDSKHIAQVLTHRLHDDNLDVALAAAEAFNTIMADHEDVLHAKTTFAVSRFLHKQRFFSSNVQKLVDSLDDGHNDGPTLLAVSHLVEHVPPAVMIGKAQQLMPIVLRSMETEDNKAVALASLKTAQVVIRDASDVAQRYFRELVPRLLKLTQFKKAMDVRIEAVKCFDDILEYPYEVIYPFFKEIVRGLVPALDDHKRKVRRETTRIRNAWYLKMEE
eukprot:gb/GECH01000815.1/.p1 GENE.gb/GECH01000815.1/~~gb/GECH01000815.1/.p1  ORF type:complete len:990 (+),score=233.89 gb/GECH01000815.1/:1-2970(+)